ncbi:hypothetical protein CJ203_10255 [Corynebacterium tuscaniense]|uniref:Uncharacterized protein n=1 Tax=Corynebacterium tuscaniense TaxID=302449 RepID=A0A2N6T2N7_9CORY|nr:hypothetical protein CJ203_10255 [Corynebacterium tuscaniense]
MKTDFTLSSVSPESTIKMPARKRNTVTAMKAQDSRHPKALYGPDSGCSFTMRTGIDHRPTSATATTTPTGTEINANHPLTPNKARPKAKNAAPNRLRTSAATELMLTFLYFMLLPLLQPWISVAGFFLLNDNP